MHGIAAAELSALTACGPSSQTTLPETALAPADALKCVMRELAKMSYQVKSAGRDAGFIQAERKAPVTGMAMLAGTSYYLEIAATVIPAAAGKPTQLSASPTRAKQAGSNSRTSTCRVPRRAARRRRTPS